MEQVEAKIYASVVDRELAWGAGGGVGGAVVRRPVQVDEVVGRGDLPGRAADLQAAPLGDPHFGGFFVLLAEILA